LGFEGDTDALGVRITRCFETDLLGLSPSDGSGLKLDSVVSSECIAPLSGCSTTGCSLGGDTASDGGRAAEGDGVCCAVWRGGLVASDWVFFEDDDDDDDDDAKCSTAQKKRLEQPMMVKLCCNSVHDP